MLRKLLICPFFGQLPEFFFEWKESAETLKKYGYDIYFTQSLREFDARCFKAFGFTSAIIAGTGKLWDYRCAFGELFAEEIKGYDYWGHTDFDVVYGNIYHFMPDDLIKDFDIITDEKNYIGGHWTLYKNDPKINSLFRSFHGWGAIMLDSKPSGWVEKEFTQHAENASVKILYKPVQASRDNKWLLLKDGALYQNGKEVMLAHFRDQKRWPL